MATKQQTELNVQPRTAGKHFSREARRTGTVPAVIYGPKTPAVNVMIARNDAVKYLRHGFDNMIFSLKSTDSKLNGLKVLRKTHDVHPLTHMPIHIDFFAPDMTKVVRVAVELKFEGKAEGTKEGGLLNIVRRDVEVECLPTEIPDSISVDVTDLMLNSSMHVSDIKVPGGVKLITSEKETICTCSIVEEEVIAAPTVDAAAAAAAGAAPGAPGAAAPGAAGAAGAPAAAGAAPAAGAKPAAGGAAPAAGAKPAGDKK